MKTKIYSSLLMISALILGTACTSDMEYKDVDVTPVKQLYSPKDGASVQLLSSATATQFFEWSSALAEDGNAPLYEIAFDKVGGDFSKPLYTLTSDDGGTRNYATVSHKVLDKIASLAGLGSGETGELQWTVISSRGIKQEIGTEIRTFKITRLLGFAEIPSEVFVTGEGSEGGTSVANAMAFSSPASGEYEIFTKLEAGKAYHFVSDKTGSGRVFYVSGTSLKESSDGTGSATVSETAVYRINLDFNIASVSMSKVVSMGWFYCRDNKVDMPLEYQGKGIWSGTGMATIASESWGAEQRYKFEMVTEKDGAQTTEHWGPTSATDSEPSAGQAETYYYMSEYPVSQWDNKWKLAKTFHNTNVKFTLYLNADGHYRHTVESAQ
jgi:hypothetical protein